MINCAALLQSIHSPSNNTILEMEDWVILLN
jgi:hypothetical protein